MPTGRQDTSRNRDLDEAKARRERQRQDFDSAVRRAHADGLSTGEAAEQLRCSKETVRKAVIRLGLREKGPVPVPRS